MFCSTRLPKTLSYKASQKKRDRFEGKSERKIEKRKERRDGDERQKGRKSVETACQAL